MFGLVRRRFFARSLSSTLKSRERSANCASSGSGLTLSGRVEQRVRVVAEGVGLGRLEALAEAGADRPVCESTQPISRMKISGLTGVLALIGGSPIGASSPITTSEPGSAAWTCGSAARTSER